MVCQKGRIIGLHGNNGSGKSTLERLMVKSRVVSSGEILWNDISYHRLSAPEIKRHVLLIFSTTNLLEGTVEENILLGRRLSLNAETLQIFERTSLQLASMIFIRESNLSQGQKRIIEMLRELYCDFDMMVLMRRSIFRMRKNVISSDL
ncbi:MAG: ATP-binding cassette domain-containing protein [Peptoniphilaceae bacterium]|nr:ATP-binding cassette domain-containing protein [Peptoniphilaceae bacterium]MDY5765408.1 ATP-binding cassette domain-containing protein [Peptoniphilaceae bacterium]